MEIYIKGESGEQIIAGIEDGEYKFWVAEDSYVPYEEVLRVLREARDILSKLLEV